MNLAARMGGIFRSNDTLRVIKGSFFHGSRNEVEDYEDYLRVKHLTNSAARVAEGNGTDCLVPTSYMDWSSCFTLGICKTFEDYSCQIKTESAG